MRNVVLLNLLFGAGPATVLWLGKVVIDVVTAKAGQSSSIDEAVVGVLSSPALYLGVVGFIVVNLVLDSAETVGTLQMVSMRDRVEMTAKQMLHEKVSGVGSVAIFESARAQDLIHLAEGAVHRLQDLSTRGGNLVTGLFVLVPTLALSASISWWVPILIFVTAVPSIHVQLKYETREWKIAESQVSSRRVMEASSSVLTRPEFAKELRVFGLRGYYLRKWEALGRRTFSELQAVRRRGTKAVLGWSLVSGAGTGVPFVYVVLGTLTGRFTLGDIALLAGLVFEARRSLFVLLGNTSRIVEMTLGIRPFFEALSYQDDGLSTESLRGQSPGPLVARSARGGQQGSDQQGSDQQGIVMAGVSFAYPGTDRYVLKDINLEVKPGELVVVVGENGAGKTTLAKLLCRLYDPTAGVVSWDGVDYREIDLNELRARIAVVFQDYARFPGSIRENVGAGALAHMEDDERITSVLRSVGLEDLSGGRGEGLETPLTRALEGGTDLSGGQWQRIAIARAAMRREARLVVLDEPTASIDPQTEHEVLELLKVIAAGRCAVVVSHRLALATFASKLVVMSRGRIVELGSHEELMDRSGLYRAMFLRQASSYISASNGGGRRGAMVEDEWRTTM